MAVDLGFPRVEVTKLIERRLAERSQTLADAISERELYFRVSVVGACNLRCPFCHNEGAPTSGRLSLDVADRAIQAAAYVGFTRVQFTGGEPLLRPDIGQFVAVARRHVEDVGVTTNGTHLPQRFEQLVGNGLRRLHVSLQVEPLEEAGEDGRWGVPAWLRPAIDGATETEINLRINLPVPMDSFAKAEQFLTELVAQGIDARVFSVLPAEDKTEYPTDELAAIVERVKTENHPGKVLMRGFREPTGIRCGSCSEFKNCKEQSHSLRLGADLMLRPCLATRTWDRRFSMDDPEASIRQAAFLALDYQW